MIDQEAFKSMLLEITVFNWHKNSDGEIRCKKSHDRGSHCPLSAMAEIRNLPLSFEGNWYIGNAKDAGMALGFSYQDTDKIISVADNNTSRDWEWARQMMESILLGD